jgi:NAD(P)H-dependent FMN reductase
MRKMQLGVIYGSTREGRLCDRIGRWVVEEVQKRPAFVVEVVDPANTVTRPEDSGPANRALPTFQPRIASSDAFIVVTPEYNRSYPASLKALIDSFKTEWHAKPVGFVSYGGMSGGLRAVEHLRNVFTELHAIGIRDGVSFANAWDRFDAQGRLLEPEGSSKAMTTMLARLSWWAVALRNAREENDYPEAAA